MAQIGLILTTDYEIFGNGTGCVEKCMIEPTERMAKTLERFGAKLTVFFDVCEYWAFEKEYEKGTLKKDWAASIENQLKDLTKRGHDVQLHFHPQWLDYSFDGENWSLNYDLWRIGQLPFEDKTNPERGLKALFERGKQTIEQIIREVKPDYVCNVFRAGAWSMQPEEYVLEAMKINEIKVDSTVAPGLYFQDEHTYFDFRGAPSSSPSYKISSSLCKEDKGGGVLEVPIFSCKVPLITIAYFQILRRIKKLQMKPKGCSGIALATAGKSKWQKVKELVFQKRKMFNFSDATSSTEMIYFAKRALKKFTDFKGEMAPVVAISHPKTFANSTELHNFLKWAENHKKIEFVKFQKLINE